MENLGDVANKVVENVNRWEWWAKSLEGEVGPIHDGDPQQGYYRVRQKGQQWEPVAIWYADGKYVAKRNDKMIDADSIWTWCCRNPISYDAYQKAMGGEGFDDEPTIAKRGIGDNSGDLSAFEQLERDYDDDLERANEFLKEKVKDQATADKIAIWSDRLGQTAKKAEAAHKVEKQPHLDGGRECDNKWRRLKTEPKDKAKELKGHLTAFLIEKQKEAARLLAIAEEEAAEKQRLEDITKAELEEKEREHQGSLQVDTTEEETAATFAAIDKVEADQRVAKVKNTKVTSGRTGARVSLVTQKFGVITDYKKALESCADKPEIKEALDKLVQRAAKADFPFDGMKIETKQVPR